VSAALLDVQVANGWATCLFTKNAVLRILGQPRYPNSPGPPAVVAPLVAELIRHPQHQFWPDSLSLLTRAMWMHRGGRLVSFDRRLGYEGVAGGREALCLLEA